MSSSINLPPSGQSQSAQPSPAGQTASPAAILRADAGVSRALAGGAPVQGTVTGSPSTGQIAVQTPAGTVTLQTAAEIPVNSQITLQAGSTAGQVRLALTPAQTQSQSGGAATSGQAANPTASQTVSADRPPAVVTTLTQGATVTATAINPPTVPQPSPQTAPQQAPAPQTPAPQAPAQQPPAPQPPAQQAPLPPAQSAPPTNPASPPPPPAAPTAPAAPAAQPPLVPPSGSQTVPQPATSALPQQPVPGTVVSTSPSLSRILIAGQTVPGTVTALTPATPASAQAAGAQQPGTVTVQTTFGAITLRLPFPVPQGASLTLSAGAQGPLQTVQVSFGAQPGTGLTAPGLTTPGLTTPGPTNPGLTASLPSGVAGAATAKAGNATAGAQVPAGHSTATATGTAQPGTIAAGSTVPIRLATILPPGAPTPALAGLSNSAAPGLPVVVGSVIGETASGAALVRTPLGHFSVPVGARAVPAGTTLVLEFLAEPNAPATGAGAHAGPAAARLAAGRPFQALQEAVALLQQSDPAMAQQVVQSLIPSAGPQLGAALLFLLQAVRFGGAPRWLGGDAVKSLERARRGSTDRLNRDFGTMRGKAVDSAGGEWRSYQLPISVGGEIEALKLYLRDREQQGQEGDKDKAKPGQRFIIEVNFTRLGPFQFDNLVDKKHIDLMIRTHSALPQDMRREIQALFADTITALGMTGQVGYHVVKSFDLNAVGDGHGGEPGPDGTHEDLRI